MGATEQDRAWLATPVGFARGVLEIPLYQWQADVLFDLEEPGQVALRCPNEAGKTGHIAAGAVLWHMMVFPGSVTVATSGSWRQVKHQLFPALHRQRGKRVFKGWEFSGEQIKAPNGSIFVAFSTNDAGKFEGFHNLPEVEVAPGVFERAPLFILVDEAKSVAGEIFEAIDRCRPDRLLIMSSPGGSRGEFYHAFGKNRALYKVHTAGFADCPHIERDKVARIIAKYGENHPFVRSSVYGEFADDLDDGSLLSSPQVERCISGGHVVSGLTGRHAACDFAAGGDENVLVLREEAKVQIVAAWRETNTMAACGEFIRLFRKLELDPSEISADNGGLGRPMVDRLAELGWPLNRVDNGGKANEPEAYADRGSEIWGEGAMLIAEGKVQLPNDPELIAQLTSRKWKDRTSDGVLRLVSKRDMKKEGLPSPDRADAVMMSLQPVAPRAVNLGGGKAVDTGWLEQMGLEEEQPELAGFNAGL